MSTEFTVITRGLRTQRPSGETVSIFGNEIQRLVSLNKTDGIGYLKYVDHDASMTDGDKYFYRYWADTESAQAWIDFSISAGDSNLKDIVIVTDPIEISAIKIDSIIV